MLIDVRTANEYARGHQPGSINIPLAQIRRINVPKDTAIRVYCKSGARSTDATKILKSMGYTNVTNLGGLA